MKAADDRERPNESTEKSRHLTSSDEELKAIFQHCDENKDGKISRGELMKFLKNLKLGIDEQQAVYMINSVDVDNDGHVDFEEFVDLYEKELSGNKGNNCNNKDSIATEEELQEEEMVMREAFDVFDEDRDGHITAEELHSVLQRMGMLQGRKPADCVDMIRRYDKDRNGSVDFEEFKEMMASRDN